MFKGLSSSFEEIGDAKTRAVSDRSRHMPTFSIYWRFFLAPGFLNENINNTLWFHRSEIYISQFLGTSEFWQIFNTRFSSDRAPSLSDVPWAKHTEPILEVSVALVVLNLESVDEILRFDYSNDIFLAVPFPYDIIYSLFSLYELHTKVWPVKKHLFSSCFA